MVRALVLNVTYEPLSVVAGRRAAVLVLTERADVVHEGDEVLHSERLALPVPSVVRLRTLVKVPYQRHLSVSRRSVLARDAHRCQYCGSKAETIDHIVPRSRGGGHSWENVVAACRPCNLRKADRSLRDCGLQLRVPPGPPMRTLWVAAAVDAVPALWEPYLTAA
jgi:5-methylcytosine-specific restriction endonuclease McrA